MAARGEAEASAKRAQRNVVLTASIAGLGGLLFGYDTGIIASALLFIRSDLDLGSFDQGMVVACVPVLIDALGRSGTFFFYAAIGLLTLWFCWKLVPETKGKRLEEIEEVFRQQAAGKA